MRLISHLRYFSATRALIRLLVETVKDMGAFLALLGMAIISFIVCFHIVSFEYSDTSSELSDLG